MTKQKHENLRVICGDMNSTENGLGSCDWFLTTCIRGCIKLCALNSDFQTTTMRFHVTWSQLFATIHAIGFMQRETTTAWICMLWFPIFKQLQFGFMLHEITCLKPFMRLVPCNVKPQLYETVCFDFRFSNNYTSFYVTWNQLLETIHAISFMQHKINKFALHGFR